MVSFIERIREAQAEIGQHQADPLLRPVEAAVRGQEAIGTAPLLDLLGMAKTTGNGRRLAVTMRSLGFVPIKSRRLMPGGYRDTVTRVGRDQSVQSATQHRLPSGFGGG